MRHDPGVGWNDRRLRALACAVTAAALLLTAVAVALHVSWNGRLEGLGPLNPGDVVLATLYPLAGLLVLWHRPRNAAGWVLLSAALVAVSLLAHRHAAPLRRRALRRTTSRLAGRRPGRQGTQSRRTGILTSVLSVESSCARGPVLDR